jgi:hypothetical protein
MSLMLHTAMLKFEEKASPLRTIKLVLEKVRL